MQYVAGAQPAAGVAPELAESKRGSTAEIARQGESTGDGEISAHP